MDLLGTRRRRRDLIALEQGHHRITGTGPLTCSCRWTGPDLTAHPTDEVEKVFARHVAAARRDRLREPLAA